jgi:hypothetical protein
MTPFRSANCGILYHVHHGATPDIASSVARYALIGQEIYSGGTAEFVAIAP